MKKRIRIDSSILSFIIILTGFCFSFEKFSSESQLLDSIMDFFGFIMILKGTLLRMSARGHKKAFSKKSDALVVTGPYQIVRNPMYLGSFILGSGFVLMLWPWWSLPFFAILFYLRFKIQIKKEEKTLKDIFRDEYKKYCETTPRVFPNIKKALKVKIKDLFNLDEAFSTKEKRGLLAWPLLAVVLETFQELVVYGRPNILNTMYILSVSVATVLLGILIRLQLDRKNNEQAPT